MRHGTYPATKMVHWPSGPVPACEKHAQALVNLGAFLGSHIFAAEYQGDEPCGNCENEKGHPAASTPGKGGSGKTHGDTLA